MPKKHDKYRDSDYPAGNIPSWFYVAALVVIMIVVAAFLFVGTISG
ncbi:hypothetical protein [Palleronia abyssalis]|nr:hypothetical protein [Palleronia abyssalis]